MKAGAPKNIKIYLTSDSHNPFTQWLEGLKDREARAKIKVRVDRLSQGNPGDYKCIGEDFYELRITHGPGYRVYFGEIDDTLVLLLCGGDKSTQSKDILQAKIYWDDYRQREGLDEPKQQ